MTTPSPEINTNPATAHAQNTRIGAMMPPVAPKPPAGLSTKSTAVVNGLAQKNTALREQIPKTSEKANKDIEGLHAKNGEAAQKIKQSFQQSTSQPTDAARHATDPHKGLPVDVRQGSPVDIHKGPPGWDRPLKPDDMRRWDSYGDSPWNHSDSGNPRHLVGSFFSARGRVDLYQGNDKYGYQHLMLRHEGNFDDKFEKAVQYERAMGSLENPNIENFMDWAIAATLQNPDDINYERRNNTDVYEKDISFVNYFTGKTEIFMRVAVVVGADSHNLITAYPIK